MAKIIIEDGGRRFQNTGYGQLSRSITRALIHHSDHQVLLRGRDGRTYSEGIPEQALFDACPDPDRVGGGDLVFRVSTPGGDFADRLPTVLYTQNALGELPSDWARDIRGADTVVVPGEFDRVVFARHHECVRVCPQVVDSDFFKPMPRYRAEGADVPSFLFVGSFSYRKGTDAIFDVLVRAFPDDSHPVHVHLQCFSGLEGDNLTLLLDGARTLPPHIRLSVDNGSLSLPWMRRILNRHDAVFTLSRGEGWCMPLWEALYSGLAVVAPDSTAMGEWLPDEGVELFGTREVEIATLTAPEAGSMVARYGEPGNTLREPVRDDAARALRAVYDDLSGYKARSLAHRETLAARFSIEAMARCLKPIIDERLALVA